MDCVLAVIIALIILVLLVFNEQVSYLLASTKSAVVSVFTGKPPAMPCTVLPDDDDSGYAEKFNSPKDTTVNSAQTTDNSMQALGFSGDSWNEVLMASELDPSTFVNHMDFVKDVRRFSSGANFTSVVDDNTNIDFVGFQGLRRPESVTIGATARQTPDIDESVLQRNRNIRW